jgi:hypothetical protein
MAVSTSVPRRGEVTRIKRGAAGPMTVQAALTAVFNVLALNAVIVIACLPILTVPLALQAGTTALGQWRTGSEDRVVVAFARALRRSRVRHTMLSVGVPVLAAAMACDELWFVLRATHAHAGSDAGPVMLGLAAIGVIVAVAASGFALVLNTRRDDLGVTDLWYLSVALAARNVLGVTPLLVGAVAVSAWLVARDPSLALVGVPLGALDVVRRAALRGIRNVEPTGHGAHEHLTTTQETAGA